MQETGERGKLIGEKEEAVIAAILARGNNAEVRRKRDGVIVLEVSRKIKYTSGGSAPGKSNGS